MAANKELPNAKHPGALRARSLLARGSNARRVAKLCTAQLATLAILAVPALCAASMAALAGLVPVASDRTV
eukprot:8632656-Lingulodinium_polyedra.AAC.1